MKKSELKDGMMVTLSNRKKYIVQGNILAGITGGGFLYLESYDENLSYKDNLFSELFEIISIAHYSIPDGWVPVSKSYSKEMAQSFNVLVTVNGRKTTVSLPDGTVASTTCLPEDNFNEEKGFTIAFIKAMMKHQAKILKELTK